MDILILGTVMGGVILYDKFINKKENFDAQAVENPVKFKTRLNSVQQNNTSNSVEPQKGDTLERGSLDGLLDMEKRTMTDFKNNYFVPNKLKSSQNMVGTGVRDNSFLDFDHRNNYRFGNDNETISKPILDRYTGIDATYMRHKETGPLFSPQEQQDRWIGQMPLTRPNLDRLKQDMRFKPDEKPCEPIRVGPGLGLGANDAADGGFNAGLNGRILPTNKFNYESNTLQGGTVPGKHYSIEMPPALPGSVAVAGSDAQYGVPQYKPDTFWTMDQRPPVASGAQHLQSQVTYSAQGGPLKTGIVRKNATQYGFGELRTKT
jgi:hypothetical protein